MQLILWGEQVVYLVGITKGVDESWSTLSSLQMVFTSSCPVYFPMSVILGKDGSIFHIWVQAHIMIHSNAFSEKARLFLKSDYTEVLVILAIMYVQWGQPKHEQLIFLVPDFLESWKGFHGTHFRCWAWEECRVNFLKMQVIQPDETCWRLVRMIVSNPLEMMHVDMISCQLPVRAWSQHREFRRLWLGDVKPVPATVYWAFIHRCSRFPTWTWLIQKVLKL